MTRTDQIIILALASPMYLCPFVLVLLSALGVL